MKLKDIKPNKANPRTIKDDKFRKLLNSIQEFPKMMELRPMVIDADGTVLGGNMRLKALQELGYTEIPDTWVRRAADLTDEEKQRFIIADNVGFGEWDWEALANEWDTADLEAWGLDVPGWANGHDVNEMTEDDVNEMQDFDIIESSDGRHRVVFFFDGETEAQSYLNQFPTLSVNKKGQKGVWSVDLSTRSI